jgi:predicted RNA-binding Zn-ribbon protein involved in translation (DUF1610 family)
MAEEREAEMMICPHCGELSWSASASDNGEPYFEPGWICPHCGEFVSDEETEYEEEEDAE